MGYRQFIYTRLFHSLNTHTHTHTDTCTHMQISVKKLNGMSQFIYVKGFGLYIRSVSSLDRSSLLIVTNWFSVVAFSFAHRRILTPAIQHTHARMIYIRLSSQFHANFANVTQNYIRAK